MNNHNQSRSGLNPLPNEISSPMLTMTVALLPLDELEPWMPEPPRTTPETTQPAGVTTEVGHSAQAFVGQAFCQFCGKNVPCDAVLCTACGRQIKALQSVTTPVETKAEKPASPAVFLLMVVVTFAFPIAGFIFGITGLSRRGKQAQGAALMALSIILVVVYFLAYTAQHH